MEKTKTFKVDFVNKRMIGNIDDLEALKQQIYIYLSIPRFEHVIFTSNIGHDLMQTIGKPKDYLLGVAKQYIIDALSIDDRIIGLDNFSIEKSNETAVISFTVSSIYEDFFYEKEVTNYGQ